MLNRPKCSKSQVIYYISEFRSDPKDFFGLALGVMASQSRSALFISDNVTKVIDNTTALTRFDSPTQVRLPYTTRSSQPIYMDH